MLGDRRELRHRDLGSPRSNCSRGAVRAAMSGARHAPASVETHTRQQARRSPRRGPHRHPAGQQHRQSVLHDRHHGGALRAAELGCNAVLKATQCRRRLLGADPKHNPDAERYDRLARSPRRSTRHLGVMDLTAAFALARERALCRSSCFRSEQPRPVAAVLSRARQRRRSSAPDRQLTARHLLALSTGRAAIPGRTRPSTSYQGRAFYDMASRHLSIYQAIKRRMQGAVAGRSSTISGATAHRPRLSRAA
jgi:hypothetical protein